MPAMPSPHHGRGGEGPPQRSLWWPPPGASGLHLAPFAGSAGRAGARSAPATRRELAVSLGRTLLMADYDAHCGDHVMALHALDCAESLGGPLSSQYAAKRARWEAALAGTQPRPGRLPVAG
jgi:hypothetical protein